MSFKNLIKKIALVAGSVALLATAGGAVSANADSNEAANNEPQINGHGTGAAAYTMPRANNLNDIKVTGHNGGSFRFVFSGENPNDTQVLTATSNSPLGRQLAAENSSNATNNNGNANDYQAGNTNNGKLVQTGENNGAEYTAVAGTILAISGVAIAGYDLRKNN